MTGFRLDWEYDRENADTGTRSRYGNYLYLNAASFQRITGPNPSAAFALEAWRIATGPVMAPALVRGHARVLSVDLERSSWNDELTANVRLIANRPHELAHATGADGDYLHDYPRNWNDEYKSIGEEDLENSAFLLTEVRVLWQLPTGKIPAITAVPTGSDALFRQAVECLDVLVWALNRQISPVIDKLENA